MSDQEPKAEGEGIVGQSASTGGLERTNGEIVEGMYQKMWKDFVSLQRGDIQLLCKDAERYRWLMQDDGHNALMATLASLCANDGPIKPQMDEAIDIAMRSNAEVTRLAGFSASPVSEANEG